MVFEFVIPSKNADLLSTDKNSYCVARVFETTEIPEKLRVANLTLNQGNVLYIFDHFDTFFSVIENAANLQMKHLIKSMDLIYASVDKLGNVLADFLLHKNTTNNDRIEMLNVTKMLIYIEVNLLKVTDKIMYIEGVPKKGKKSAEDSEHGEWDKRRYNIILQLFNVLQLPIENLWDPPVAEESFVNMISDIAYRTLEHHTIRNKNVEDTTFQLLGTLLKRYNHALVFPVRILQIIETCEMSLSPIANGLILLYDQYGIQTIISVIIKELLDRLNVGESDAVITKHFSMFLSELGNMAPNLMISHVSVLAEDILNMDSYQLRNCILQMMSEIIISELTAEDLPDDLKDTRDDFLEDIYSHMQDVHAHVRSKVLQIWNEMKSKNAVPLSWQHRVLTVAVDRLEDKSIHVRKYAIGLVKAFLEHNPFAAKLSIEELTKRYEDEKLKLQEIRTKMIQESQKLQNIDTQWDELLPEIHPFVEEVLLLSSIDNEKITSEDCKNIMSEFGEYMSNKKYRELMLVVRKAEENTENFAITKAMTTDLQCLYYEELLKSYFMLLNKVVNHEDEFKKAENNVKYLEDSIEFSSIIINAVPKLQDMLMSKSNSDVFEAIDFFTTAYMFGIKNTESGMRQMLFLVWSSDKEKRDPVREAYKRVLLTTDQSGRAHTAKVVFNLIRFMERLTDGHYIAFEELVKEWIIENDIDSQMIQVMFEIYTFKFGEVSDNDSRLALQLLIICSTSRPSIAIANIELLENIGFEGRGLTDSRIFAQTLTILMNSVANQSENASKFYKRKEHDNNSVKKVVDIFIKYFFAIKSTNFDDVCSKTFLYLYKMCEAPDSLSQQIITTIFDRLQVISEQINVQHMTTKDENEDVDSCVVITQAPVLPTQTQVPSSGKVLLSIPVTLSARFIFFIGHVAMRELIHLDIDVYSNLRYRQELTDAVKNNNKNKKAKNKRKTMQNDSANAALKRMSIMPQADQDSDTDDVVGASAEDAFAEQINHICEQEMLFPKESLLRRFCPMTIEVLKFPTKYKHDEIQQAAVLALIHIMSVSSKFCENNIPFLMNIFQHTKNIKIKCNIIIGLSDFTFRFPNVIEPWSGQLYSTLHDKDNELRLTTVKILAHLISHEMILVRGQISDLAICIVDENLEIKTITQQFFKEIANKSNILYNALPDIISRLSDPSLNLVEINYHIIMKYIIGLINKDRQVESLIEKLCFRFRITNQERQWRDIAYCLSLLTYTEKTIKKLMENIRFFKDKVQVEEVYNSFKQIIHNTLKLSKIDLKNAVQEFEAKLEECLVVNDEEENANSSIDHIERGLKATTAKKPVKGRGKVSAPVRGRGRVATRGRGRKDSSSDSELENQPPRGGPRAKKPISDSDSDSPPPTKASKNKAPTPATSNSRSSRSKVIEDSTSDDDEAVTKKPPSKRSKSSN